LKITNTIPENSGVYVCLATNTEGSDQSATVVDVERKCNNLIRSLCPHLIHRCEQKTYPSHLFVHSSLQLFSCCENNKITREKNL